MQCEICKRPSSSRLPFYCALCARDTLQEPRILIAIVLLQGEAIGRDVERNLGLQKAIVERHPAKLVNKTQEPISSWALERATTERVACNGKTEAILSHVEALRTQTTEMKAEISRRRMNLARRRSNLQAATQNILQLQTSAIEPVEKGVKRTEHRWDALHAATLEARVFLCREAAQLYGLRQRKLKKGGPGKDVYTIGGVPIADLRELNSPSIRFSLFRYYVDISLDASPAHVTTSTANLAHLVYLVSHYLTLRLPAEITLPHRDYPLPTIFSPGSSYTMRDVPFPGSTSSQSSNNSPSTSRTVDSRPLPRPRPLHIEKKLSALATEDPLVYALFVEGMTLLAWDIAWLCKTQGLNVGDGTWEEVCSMGRNLWQLLVARSTVARPPISWGASGQDVAVNRSVTSRRDPAIGTDELKKPQYPATMGHYSHGTAHSFLATAEGMEYMRSWRLQSPLKVIEKVKAMLLSERTGAEWELLEGNEWEEEVSRPDEAVPKEVNVEEEAVFVKGKRREGGFHEERSVMSAATGFSEEAIEKGKGTSGWTKVKSRA